MRATPHEYIGVTAGCTCFVRAPMNAYTINSACRSIILIELYEYWQTNQTTLYPT